MRILFLFIFILIAACSLPYNLTDRSGAKFYLQDVSFELGDKQVEKGGDLKYWVGGATVDLKVSDIVSLTVPEQKPTFFEGRVFYPATLILEDSVSIPHHGFISIEGSLTGESAGQKIRIPMANVQELSRHKEE